MKKGFIAGTMTMLMIVSIVGTANAYRGTVTKTEKIKRGCSKAAIKNDIGDCRKAVTSMPFCGKTLV